MRIRSWRCLSALLTCGVCFLNHLSATSSVALAQNAAKPVAEKVAKTAEADPRAADRAAIRKTMQSFSEAFQKGDAAAAAAFMSSGAELIPDDGSVVRGREAIQAAYTAFFSKNARPKISVDVQDLKFPSRDTAIEEGVMTITPTAKDDTEVTRNHYQILYVREDGKWYLASVHESHIEKTELEDLEWLIGTWSAKRQDAEVQTTYEWFGNKSFILARFSVREKETSVTGMQLIGIDPDSNSLRTWTFEFDGGVGEGSCIRDGKQWIFETNTSLTDSRIMSAKNILVKIDKNTFTWQPVNLSIDGEQVSDLPPMKVVRVESKK